MAFDDQTHCPHCGAQWQGEEIPEDQRELFGNATHFSKLIGIYSLEEDRTTHWMCPECETRWKR